MEVEFYKHNIGDDEQDSISKVLKSRFITTGPVTSEFENKFAKYLNKKYCVGVSSWTAGNLITLKALDIGAGDEVITTPMSFIATSNTILHVGAKPVFVDVDYQTGNINLDLIEKAITKKTKAIIPIHLYGQMCDMKKLNNIAKKYNLIIIEDCAHCIEGERDGIKPGQLSNAALFSFYATKNITSGEGGAIVTDDKTLYNKLKKYRMHGMSSGAEDRFNSGYKHWDMELLGYKCNMGDLQAALLIPQLKKIEKYWRSRKTIYKQYFDMLKGLEHIALPTILPGTKHAYHLFTIWVNQDKRDDLILYLKEKQIGITINYRAIHLLSYYRRKYNFSPGAFKESERIGNSTISLPFFTKIEKNEIEYVVKNIFSFFT